MGLKITNIQEFSLHDGPGIRTTIFLSGCPLRCAWCHNPETQSVDRTLLWEADKCIGCRACLVCPQGVHCFEQGHFLERKKCNMCGTCTNVCPTHALRFSMRELTDTEFLKLVRKQNMLYGEEGGITFSGGEPLMQGEEILRLLEEIDVHTAIETCGYAQPELFERIIDKMDYIMFDIKLADEQLHRKYTGVSNKRILKNFEILKMSGKKFVIRTPLIPGITDTKENLAEIEAVIQGAAWEQLPYNTLAPSKYEWMGREYPLNSMVSHNL